MEVFYGDELVDKLRDLCDNVKKRLWIVSPFIGNWEDVIIIIGRKWFENGSVDVKLITDISQNGGISPDTFKHFRDRGEVRTIKGVHAKIYIIDNSAIVTSANLTGMAFFKRFEVGISLSDRETKSLIDLYDIWWNKFSENIPVDYVPKKNVHRKNEDIEGRNGEKLEERWNRPQDPGDPAKKITTEFSDYEYFLNCYNDFANIYKKIQRLWPKAPLFFETDAFLDYLFHNDPDTSTKKFIKVKPRKLNKEEREKEIKKYALKFKKEFSIKGHKWRLEYSKKIRNILSKNRIQKITSRNIKDVLDSLNCMNSRPGNKSSFFKKNNIKKIRNSWENLLYGNPELQIRMSECKNTLKYFGKSSIHELIGFFDPDRYPLRNRNTNAGLRFFGYDISAY